MRASCLGMVLAGLTGCSGGDALRGRVTDGDGHPLGRTFVTIRNAAGVATSVMTRPDGRYTFADLAGSDTVSIRAHGFRGVSEWREDVVVQPGTTLDFAVRDTSPVRTRVASAFYLGLLPDGTEKRRFIRDCTGCHQFNHTIALDSGRVRSRESWVRWVDLMLSFAGANTGFPIIAADRDAGRTADWLVGALGDGPDRYGESWVGDPELLGNAIFTEYDLPHSRELPHDLMVGTDGRVMITGMMTHGMHDLDPLSGRFASIEIPVPFAGPRALDRDPEGRWWVLLGNPRKLARYDPASREWRDWDIGMYPHSIMTAPDGVIWFNGHFSRNPPVLGRFDPGSETVVTFDVPEEGLDPDAAPIPYGLRVDADGTVWSTELHGDRLIRFDPTTESFRTYVMPTPSSGPRRLDIGPDGTVWIPEYAGNALARFDPSTETFTRYPFPLPDALPYVTRVDRVRGTVWTATAAADAVVSFDPARERFTVYLLPTRTALIRHIDIDQATGAVWAAYGDSPAVHPRILRLQPR